MPSSELYGMDECPETDKIEVGVLALGDLVVRVLAAPRLFQV